MTNDEVLILFAKSLLATEDDDEATAFRDRLSRMLWVLEANGTFTHERAVEMLDELAPARPKQGLYRPCSVCGLLLDNRCTTIPNHRCSNFERAAELWRK